VGKTYLAAALGIGDKVRLAAALRIGRTGASIG
jgi:hypothetical protein